MISALEAKKKAQNSKERVTKFLEVLGVEIEKAAEQGKYEYTYGGGLSLDPTNSVSLSGPTYAMIDTPEFWKLVKDALTAPPNCYRVVIGKSAPFTPSGLGMMDDNPEPQVSLEMRISWA